jgi:flagellar L-ring protein precursor FlgH
MTRAGLSLGAVIAACVAGCVTMPEPDPHFRPAVAAPSPASNATGSIYQQGYGMEIFSDIKPRRVGDILTVILTESTVASKQAQTQTQKDDTLNLNDPTLFGNRFGIGSNINQQREFDGSGQSQQQNSLIGNITVTVIQVYPNGNLFVRGEKVMGMNQGYETIKISGIVRPYDIQTNNAVLSTQIADFRVEYRGKGALADANRQGWASRFFSSILWPF